MRSFEDLLNEYSSLSYADQQQQSQLQSLGLTVQANDAALQIMKTDALLAKKDATQALVERLLFARDAIAAQKEQVDVIRQIQDFQNMQYDRKSSSLMQNTINYAKAAKLDISQQTQVAAQRVGAQKTSIAAGGVIATEGSSADVINQTIVESQKDINKTYSASYGSLLQANEEVVSLKAQQLLNNFNVDTRVNFNVEELNKRLRYI